MNRYFFDVVGHDQSELDYTGRMLSTVDEAYAAAEMMAFDLAVKRADEMAACEVAVSNPDGRKLFSIPVKESYLTAMPAEWGLSPTVINRARNIPGTPDTISRSRGGPDVKTRKLAA